MKAWASVALVATATACAEKAETATNACSPLADKVTYEAVTPDGHYVVIVGDGGSGSRVFYGTADHMTEGRITNTLTGCAIEVDFNVEGTSYGAVFAYPSCNGVITSKLVIGEVRVGAPLVAQPLTVLHLDGSLIDAGAAAASRVTLSFFCF